MEKINQYLQKLKIDQAQFSVQFFIACIVLTLAFFLVFISGFKTYTASITILVNTKSEVAAQQEKQIIDNVLEFPRLLSFYDRLLKYDPDVRDLAENKSQAQRKDFWNSMLSVKQVGQDSSLIKISITTSQKNDAQQLVQKTAETLFHFTGFYYDIKNDVDLRIVDGPISESNIFGWWWMLPLSLVLGFLATIFLQKMIAKSIDNFVKKENFLKNKNFFDFNLSAGEKTPESSEAEMESLKELYMSEQAETAFPIQQKTDTAQFQEMKKLTKMTEQDKYPNFREVPKQTEQKASAPDNLPIADASFLMQTSQEHTISEKAEIKKQEPTADELKERLNKLLRGEI
jgi:capsular polysaccharide biosynthesis protein